MGKGADRQEYIHNLAGTILAGNSVYPKDAKELFQWYSGMVSRRLNQFTDQTLGKIVACGISRTAAGDNGNTSIAEVRGCVPLDLFFDGRRLLLELAVTVVIAAMMDIIKSRANKD